MERLKESVDIMIDFKIGLDSIPYDTQKAIGSRLEELKGVKVISAILNRNINATLITFENNSEDPEKQAKRIINVLRRYAIYKKQMPAWNNPCWAWDLMVNNKYCTIFLVRKT